MGIVMPSVGGVPVNSMRTCSKFTAASGTPVEPPHCSRGSFAPVLGRLTFRVPEKFDQSPVTELRK